MSEPSLRGKPIYLAHPIDWNPVSEVNGWYQIKSDLVGLYGAVVFDPGAAFSIKAGVPTSDVVHAVNREALDRSVGMVAIYPEYAGIGVAAEIEYANSIGMPVLVVLGEKNRSWVLAGMAHVRETLEPSAEDYAWLRDRASRFRSILGDHSEPCPVPLLVAVDRPELMPVRKHADDAGFDLFVAEERIIEPGATVDVPCGVRAELPEGVWGLIVGRSSAMRSHSILVHPGIIDTGYRGPLFTLTENRGTEPFTAKVGMRLGQMIPLPNLAAGMEAQETDWLNGSERGDAGFGSTGT